MRPQNTRSAIAFGLPLVRKDALYSIIHPTTKPPKIVACGCFQVLVGAGVAQEKGRFEMENNNRGSCLAWLIGLGALAILGWFAYSTVSALQQTADSMAQPVNSLGTQVAQALQPVGALSTQVSEVLHPTPTVMPDPVTIIHSVRSLARLETVQYTVEKVVTAEEGQKGLSFLFGDRLLFVAHGVVIAGVDLAKLQPQDLWVENGVLYVRLPEPEVFVATLDNQKSYVYDRETGLLTHGDIQLETAARQVAEREILQAALDDGILDVAKRNAEAYLTILFRDLGFHEVLFVEGTPVPTAQPTP